MQSSSEISVDGAAQALQAFAVSIAGQSFMEYVPQLFLSIKFELSITDFSGLREAHLHQILLKKVRMERPCTRVGRGVTRSLSSGSRTFRVSALAEEQTPTTAQHHREKSP